MNPRDEVLGDAGRDSRPCTDLVGDFLGGEGEGVGDLSGLEFSLSLLGLSASFFLGDLLKILLNMRSDAEAARNSLVGKLIVRWTYPSYREF